MSASKRTAPQWQLPWYVFSTSAQLQRHEYAVGIERVIAERPALAESEAVIEAASRGEALLRAGLEAQAPVTAPPRLIDDVRKHRASRAATAHGLRRAHGLDLALACAQLLQRADADE